MSGITVTGGIQGLGGFTVVQPEYFSPILLFQSNENGAWYDPSDYATMFQDNVGATPVTAAGQSVGMILDKSQGLVLGPELVTNGTFDSATGWTLGTGWSISGGKAVATNAPGFSSVQQGTGGRIAGLFYKISIDVVLSAGQLQLGLGTYVPSINTSGSYTFILPATNNIFGFRAGSSGFTGTVDNVSVKLLPGNHATQSTSSQRPILGRNPITGTRNRLTYTEQFDNAAWTKTGGAISATNGTAPDGSNTADTLTEDTSTGSHLVLVNAGGVVDPNTAVTLTVYAKQETRRYMALGSNTRDNLGAYVAFDLQDGTAGVPFGGNSASVTSSSITSVGGGWYRCRVSISGSSGGAGFRFVAAIVTSISPTPVGGLIPESYTGNGTGNILIWGAQLEIGPTLTPYQRVVSQYDVTESGIADAYYLAFDGSDDNLVTNSVNFTSTTAMSVFSGVAKTANSGVIVELSANYTTNSGDFTLQSSPGYTYGSNTADAAVGGFVAPVTSVVTGLSSITNDISITRVNGTQLALSSADQGAGSYGNYPIYIGRRGGSTLPFKGRIYALIIRGANTTNPAQVEAWINERTGAYTEGQYALSLDFVSQQYTTETII